MAGMVAAMAPLEAGKMNLPILHTTNKDFMLMQNRWKAILDPVIANPSNQSAILKEVSLKSGSNTINHLLGHTLRGWKIIRQRAAAAIYDTQDTNQRPELTLLLTSDNPVVVDIEVM